MKVSYAFLSFIRNIYEKYENGMRFEGFSDIRRRRRREEKKEKKKAKQKTTIVDSF